MPVPTPTDSVFVLFTLFWNEWNTCMLGHIDLFIKINKINNGDLIYW